MDKTLVLDAIYRALQQSNDFREISFDNDHKGGEIIMRLKHDPDDTEFVLRSEDLHIAEA